MGWGSHERNFPRDGKRHDSGCLAAIYLMQPGAATRVRTWTPRAGHFHGFCITHSEAISIADYFTVREGAQVAYRPTVHYAYHPCDSAVMSVHELAGRNYVQQERQRILMDEIIGGIDELGVLLAGHKKNAYWYGSQLSIEEARKLAPYNNATSLQVCVAVLAGRRLGDGESQHGRRSSPTRWTTAATSRSACPTSGPWSGSTPSGPRCTSASGCSPRTSTRATRGSSRTCA